MNVRLTIYIPWFAAQLIIALVIGAVGLGNFTLAFIFAAVIACLAGGLFLPISPRDPKQNSSGVIVGNSLFVSIVGGGIISGLLLLYSMQDSFLSVIGINTSYLGMAITAIVPSLLFANSKEIMRLFRKERLIYWMDMFMVAALLLSIYWLSMKGILSGSTSIAVWVLILSVTAVISFTASWIMAKSAITFSPSLLIAGMKANLYRFTAEAILLLIDLSGIILIAYFLNVRDVGIFVIAMMLIGLLWRTGYAFANVQHLKNKLTPRPLRISFSVSIISAVFVAFLSWILIKFVIGDEFFGSIPVLLVMLPGAILISQSRMLYRHSYNSGSKIVTLSILLAVIVINIILNVLLIPELKLTGAAISYSITQIIFGMSLLYLYYRNSSTRLIDLFLLHDGDLSLMFRHDRERK